MSNTSYDAEQVSCCVDGESTGYLDAICVNESARSRWSRFHFIRGILRSNEPPLLDEDFHTRVMQALENEPTVLAPKSRNPNRIHLPQKIVKPVAGLSIAASVAAITVAVIQMLLPVSQNQVLLSSTDESPRIEQQIAQDSTLVSSEAEMILANDSLGDELDTYLLGHMEQSASGGNAQGMLPYVRLAGYNDSQ